MSLRIRWTALAVVFSCAIVFVASISRADAAADELDKLKGKWVATSVDEGKGPNEKAAQSHPFVLVFEGNKVRVIEGRAATQPSTRPAGDLGTVKIDPAGNPATMDWNGDTSKEDKTRLIYKLEGDTLTVCFGSHSDTRPTEFKGGKGSIVLVLKREK